jgi:hypothetical protein
MMATREISSRGIMSISEDSGLQGVLIDIAYPSALP